MRFNTTKILFIILFFSINLIAGDTSVMLQGFKWDSVKTSPWWKVLRDNAYQIKNAQIDIVWFPPSEDSLSDEGYLPRQLFIQDSKYGTSSQLLEAINKMHSYGIKVLADVVLNHRVGVNDWADFKNPDWPLNACTKDDEYNKCLGSYDTGKAYEAARDIDHTNTFVRQSIIQWLNWLQNSYGYDGFRYDYARGFATKYFIEYENANNSSFSVAEIWDDLNLYDTNSHRQALVDWIKQTEGKIKVFDFTTKGILQDVLNTGNYQNLKDNNNNPSGLIGSSPSNSVTFIENHDTAIRQSSARQKAWPFPSDKIMQGYAYILTHPGIPCIFWPHFFDYGLKDEITKLISIRKKYGINSQSKVNILNASYGLYVANIDNKIIVKLGFYDYTPESSFKLIASGTNYKIWAK